MQISVPFVADSLKRFIFFPASDFLIFEVWSRALPSPIRSLALTPVIMYSVELHQLEAISDDPQRLQSLAVATNQSASCSARSARLGPTWAEIIT